MPEHATAQEHGQQLVSDSQALRMIAEYIAMWGTDPGETTPINSTDIVEWIASVFDVYAVPLPVATYVQEGDGYEWKFEHPAPAPIEDPDNGCEHKRVRVWYAGTVGYPLTLDEAEGVYIGRDGYDEVGDEDDTIQATYCRDCGEQIPTPANIDYR